MITQVKNAFMDMSFDESNFAYSCVSSEESEGQLLQGLDIVMITKAFRDEVKSFILKCAERFPFPDFDEIAQYFLLMTNGRDLMFLKCMQRGAIKIIRSTYEKYVMNRVGKLNKKFQTSKKTSEDQSHL